MQDSGCRFDAVHGLTDHDRFVGDRAYSADGAYSRRSNLPRRDEHLAEGLSEALWIIRGEPVRILADHPPHIMPSVALAP